MHVGEPLPVVVLHDEIRFAFLDGPRRREAVRLDHCPMPACITGRAGL
jgi:hypothetical protein